MKIEYLNRVGVVERADGGISITRFSKDDMSRYGYSSTPQGEDDFIAWYMNRVFPGVVFSVIDDTNIPKDPNGNWDRSQRTEWSLKSGKVEVDPIKVAAKQAKQTEKDAILSKLKISREEFNKLFD